MATYKSIFAGAIALGVALATTAQAGDIGVSALKFISIDKEAAASKSKTVFVAKVPEAAKNSNDVTDIAVELAVQYAGASGDASATFEVPAGESVAKGPGWLVNKETVAKFVNKDAPGGPTGAKVVVIKPTKLLKLIGKTRGDSLILDLIGADTPAGSVFTAFTVDSGGIVDNFCSEFPSCAYKEIGGGTGRKLVCKGSTPDGGCTAAAPACLSTSGCFCDTGLTVIDTCTNLEWEKKDTFVGSGVDAGNLHDVDNLYTWAGRCTISNAQCQPNAAAAATCAAQTGGASGCAECGAGGTCDVNVFDSGAITTIWDWVNQVNTAGYAGHSDWRVPWVAHDGPAAELETIIDSGAAGCGGGSPCIDPIFGPTGAYIYWSASTRTADPSLANGVNFFNGVGAYDFKVDGDYVRALRPGS